MHTRAAAWFDQQGNRGEALYHRLQADPVGVFAGMRAAIEAALERADWPAAQSLIGAAAEVDLPAGSDLWLTLYKAELAHGEGNMSLSTERLHSLLAHPLDDALTERLATRLEDWYGLQITTTGDETPPSKAAPHFFVIWWARLRHDPRREAYCVAGSGRDGACRWPAMRRRRHSIKRRWKCFGASATKGAKRMRCGVWPIRRLPWTAMRRRRHSIKRRWKCFGASATKAAKRMRCGVWPRRRVPWPAMRRRRHSIKRRWKCFGASATKAAKRLRCGVWPRRRV